MRANQRHAVAAGALLLAVAASGAAAAGQPQAPFTAGAASRLIAELGPPKAAEQILNDSPTLEVVAAGVAGGSREWLDVGGQLIGVAESYLKDRLTQSFSIALERDPASVLARGASGVPVQAVCAYDPFTAAETPPTRSQFDGAVAQRERVVSAVQRADLAAAKSRCLEGVAALRSAGTKLYQP
jgi:hypothetical protein